jgi:hypothetical protein
LQVLQKQVLDNEKGDQWRVVDGITSHDRVFVPVESPTLPDLLAHTHGCDHEGTEKTLHKLPGARTVVHDFVHASYLPAIVFKASIRRRLGDA